MRFKKNKSTLFQYFKKRESFTTNDVFDFFAQTDPAIKRATVNWRIYELVRRGLLKRIGRGMFALGQADCFLPVLTKKQQTISARLEKQFPLITICCWHTSALKEFFQHLAVYDFLLVEVERDAVDAVFHFIKETHKNTFKEPSREIIENFVLDGKDAVIVKSLISEAPLQETDALTLPTIEKILVDLVADREIFFFLQGHEILNIFESALGKYTVNTDRLLRYAKRRNKREELQKILTQINGKNQ
jgi:DNA-binding Lrp family transcriptional regulator